MNKEIEEIQEEIKNHRDETAKFQKFDLEALKKKNFITTKGALNKLNEIYNYIKLGIHLIIEGPTGTSKIFSVEIICNQLIEDQKKDSSKILVILIEKKKKKNHIIQKIKNLLIHI